MGMSKKTSLKLIIVAVALVTIGCSSFGPQTITKDRFNYTTVLSDSWKDQMLLNIVKIRYGDAPIFLDVSSVINSYELSGRAGIGGDADVVPNFGANAYLDVYGTYANRPTITYIPLSGERFAKSLMSPIPISPVLSLIQSGYSADLVLRILVQSVNGLENRYSGKNTGNPEFYQLTRNLKEIQSAGAIGLRLKKLENGEVLTLVFKNVQTEEMKNKIRDIKTILGLNQHENEFSVIYGVLQPDDKTIAILSRSMLQVLNELSYYMEVPEKDVEDNRVNPSYGNLVVEGEPVSPLIRIYNAELHPEDAFVAVPYNHHWFWIDNKDLHSKQVFSFLMFTFTLVETGNTEGKPLVTVPVR